MRTTPEHPPRELRLSLTVTEYARVVGFYRDVLGLTVRDEFITDHGSGIILEAGVATLELLDEEHAAHVDEVEVGYRVSGRVRLAIEVVDARTATARAAAAGATVLAEPTRTPWNSLNSRLEDPDGFQLTLFEELG
jgi:predicted enzyme related to lactoylglutathione lyase